MAKKIFVFVLLAVFVITAAAMAATSKTMPIRKDKILTGEESLPPGPVYPLNPATITESPGVQVGTTHYDYQSNGSSGNRMVVLPDGSRYFDWMNGLNYPTPRHVYFNYIDNTGSWYAEGTGAQVNRDLGAGYTQMDAIHGNRAAITYHSMANGNPLTYTTLAIDSDPPGLGIFGYTDPPDLVSGNRHTVWPYITVDRNNRIHLLMTESTPTNGVPQRLCYTRSADDGAHWVTPVQFVDTVMVMAGVMDASPVSDKVVLAYSKTEDTSTQWYNDIVYVLSNDGLTWNFNNRVNVTNYGQNGDSLWAYTDMDVIFDYNDNVNLIWNAQWVTTAGIYYKTFLKFYNGHTGQITDVAPAYPDSTWPQSGCDFGAWNRAMTKMNLGVYHTAAIDAIFATWTQFDTSDCSAGGYANGDIYMAYTINNGATWSAPVDVTNSHTPGCEPGDCDSDHWSTLADVVNDSLHIFYVDDKDAGGLPQTEGANTENPMMYLRVHNPLASGIDEQAAKPVNFSLVQNYPNPFNSNTIISFDLKQASPVKVEVFNITGAKVTTLVNKDMSAGHHEVTWNASKNASGIYYYRLTAGSSTETKQMVYLK